LALAAARVRWARVLADAAFDADRHHEQCRDDYRIRSTVIPLNRRGRRQWPRSRYRRPRRRRFFRRVYRQRWQIESAFSRHKRLLGDALRAIGTYLASATAKWIDPPRVERKLITELDGARRLRLFGLR
jgi:Transposase DDE domain